MMRIQVELWMWLGKKLGGDFQSPSEMRSTMEMDVEEGMTVKNLFADLADRYPAIAKEIFDRENHSFYPNLTVMVTCSGQAVASSGAIDTALKDGYRIMVLPLYAGG
jgi:molybdopterin converting factor small subunit